MPYTLRRQTPAPARVHGRGFEHTGHRPSWVRRLHGDGIYDAQHFRICSWCGCIHPEDLIDLLRLGQSKLERTTKPGKHVLVTPNPIAGRLVQMGSVPGPVFAKHCEPADLVSKLLLAPRPGIAPTMAERLAEHFERPCFEAAPAFLRQPFYAEHTTEPQWAEIEAAAEGA